MVAKAIDTCPFCNATPNVVGFWRYQVSCDCGACGPKVSTQHEAIHRWSSVVRYIIAMRREWFSAPSMAQALGSAG